MFNLGGLDPTNSSGGASTLGTYRTTDDAATVLTAGYFDPAASLLRSTKMLMVTASDRVFLASVSVAGSVVTVTDWTAGLLAASAFAEVEPLDEEADAPAIVAWLNDLLAILKGGEE